MLWGLTRQANIAYHEVTDEPDQGPGAFKLEVKHGVSFKPADAVAVSGESQGALPSMLQTQVGARVDSKLWKSSWADIVWSVKWGSNGLCPIRPHVLVTHPITLAIQTAVLLK